jgi:streptomycin 6-kinase
MTLTPDQTARLEAWDLQSLAPVDDHPFAWWATRGDEHVVVKAGDPRQRHREAIALQAFGPGATQVIAHDRGLGLLVTRRVLPGDDIRPLSRRDDDEASRVIARIASSLHRDQGPSAGLPPLEEMGAAFDAPRDPRLPDRVTAAARRVFMELLADPVDPVVLHGDLQQLNVLNAGDGWCAIDPHGWVGDPAFEAAALLANPRGLVECGDARGMDGGALAARSLRRAEIYAEETGVDLDRVRSWGFVGCVIAELRMIESHDMIHGAPLAVADAMLARGV